jgi:uncharacterized SAM-binding protein YcdF (DUF218 family)
LEEAGSLSLLSREEALRIARFLDVSAEPPDHAEEELLPSLAFVFGTRFLQPAHVAADLFRRGVANYVVLTGGANRVTGMNEAMAHRDVLAEEEIPRDRIILENRSTNTLENVLFALPVIAARVDPECIKMVVAVTKWYHSRRAIMTLKRHWPRGIRYFCASYEPNDVTRQNWYLHRKSLKTVLKEWQSIPAYLEQGHIAEIQREDGALI